MDDARSPGGAEKTAGRYDVALFAAIVIFALTLRVIYVLELRSNPMFEHPVGDELYHDQWARTIVAGETFTGGPYFRAPLYPLFLAAVYKIFGGGYLVPRLVQSLLGSLACGLVFVIGRGLFNRKIAAVAGFVAAGYWILIYFDAELLIPPLIVILDLLLLWLLFRAAAKPGRIRYGIAGLVLGLSAIARPNILLFAPAIVVWLLVMYRTQWRRSMSYAVCFGLGCLLPVLPITLRNYAVGGDWVLISSQGGVNFYIGNNPLSNGMNATVPGTPGDWWGGYYATIERAEKACGRKLRPSEVSGYYFGQAWDFIAEQPARALALTAWKLRVFWVRWEILNNKDIYFWTERFTPVVKLLPLGFWIVGPFGLVGLMLCWRRPLELFPLWGFILVYMASVVVFFCNARYRTPILCPLILLAAHGLFWCIGTIRQDGWRGVLRACALLLPAMLFVNVTGGADQFKQDYALSYQLLGEHYARQGKLELAIENCREALQRRPDLLTSRSTLGVTLLQLGRTSEAIEQLRLALAATPNLWLGETAAKVAGVHSNLGNALGQVGDWSGSLIHHQKAVELNPDGEAGMLQCNLGVALSGLGREEEAIDAFRRAVKVNPNLRNAHYNLGLCLARAGKLSESVTHYREALRIRPNDVESLYLLSETMVRASRFAEAVEILAGALPLRNEFLADRLAWLLATCSEDTVRDGARALSLARAVCPNVETCNVAYLDTLAAALAETGQFEDAVKVARRALRQAREAATHTDTDLPERIAARLELYQARRPYHQPRPPVHD